MTSVIYEELLMREFGVSRVQLDELWTQVSNKGGRGSPKTGCSSVLPTASPYH